VTCRPASDDVEAQCTIVVAPDDLIDMVNGKLNSAKALRQGRLQISGEINLANRWVRFSSPGNQVFRC
jgi:putative sterol carrier protein